MRFPQAPRVESVPMTVEELFTLEEQEEWFLRFVACGSDLDELHRWHQAFQIELHIRRDVAERKTCSTP